MLELYDLYKYYGNLAAVAGVTLEVAKGQVVGLIGPNGSGKSSLLSTVAGALNPDAGRIVFNGQEIAGEPADHIFRLGLARSYQDPSLFFRMSVVDNALLPPQHQRGEQPWWAPFHAAWWQQESLLTDQAGEMLEDLRLLALYDAMAADLSGGQMKLLELGRTLMGAPAMMLLDEPTAGVAPNLAYTIFEEIDRLRRQQGVTFLIVEHRLDILFDFVDTVYVMHLGKLIAQGSPAQIAENPVVKEIYFGE